VTEKEGGSKIAEQHGWSNCGSDLFRTFSRHSKTS